MFRKACCRTLPLIKDGSFDVAQHLSGAGYDISVRDGSARRVQTTFGRMLRIFPLVNYLPVAPRVRPGTEHRGDGKTGVSIGGTEAIKLIIENSAGWAMDSKIDHYLPPIFVPSVNRVRLMVEATHGRLAVITCSSTSNCSPSSVARCFMAWTQSLAASPCAYSGCPSSSALAGPMCSQSTADC